MNLTERAYNYAKQKKKVNQGVIEAWRDGHERGKRDAIKSPTLNLIEEVKSRYRSRHDVEYELGMSDARRGPNKIESKEIKIRSLITKFEKDLIEQLEELKELRSNK